MSKTRGCMLERVLGILDPEMVSVERMEAFRSAAALYNEWRRELVGGIVAETVKEGKKQ